MKSFIRGLIVFYGIIVIMQGLLCLVAVIPREKIKDNMLESGKYFHEREMLPMITNGAEGSMLHSFADETILSIAYYLNPEKPLESAIWSNYYVDGEHLNDSLLYAVEKDLPSNREYLRYWHGSVTILRPLHMIMSVKEIKVFNGVVLCLLCIILMTLLWRADYRLEAAALAVSLFLVSAWVVPFCLEYTWTFLIMLLVSIASVSMALKRQYSSFLYFLSGMITVYFDFLTAETLTLLIPLLLALRIRKKESDNESIVIYSAKCCMLWLCGYCFTWGSKWAIAADFMKQNSLIYVSDHVAERLYGEADLSHIEFLREAITLNIKNQLFFDYGLLGAAAFFIMAAVVFIFISTGVIGLRKVIDVQQIMLYAGLGIIPYVRFLVLNNHSYYHSFFTYRAQMASVMALFFILFELLQKTAGRTSSVSSL